MPGEDTRTIGQIHDRLAKLWPTTETLTDLYHGFQHYSGWALDEWVTHAPFVSQIQAGVTKLWPSAETFTDLYQRLQRGSGQAVSDWVTRASATLLPRNGGSRTRGSRRQDRASSRDSHSCASPE